ncbi:hypothetical protein SDC9_69331 [bioreactor metagenome]|uniref:site-specific DNA-methyltransferase (cytosine-N(4)-specific) n=1 Tax=bioreactor metagenome TaxID=1076179 RepID=A0A644Y4L4_9ZZZZ
MGIENLIAELKTKEDFESYWDFRRNDDRSHVHSLLKYPAVMVPGMQGEIFDLILKHDPTIKNVLDPFMGSGTVLIEAMIRGLDIKGIDINPLAYLTVLAKTQLYHEGDIKIKINELIQRIDSLREKDTDLFSFTGINKWYTSEVLSDLSKIRLSILQEPDVVYRRFFWVAFAEIAKQADNSRTSTFKLHIKLDSVINESRFDCIQSFRKKIFSNLNAISEFNNLRKEAENQLYYGDSRIILNDKRSFPENSIDLIITSPPYGDNTTTITYGQYSILPLRWIPLTDINELVDEEVIKSLSKIDKDSLGGTNYHLDLLCHSDVMQSSPHLKNFIEKLLLDKETEKARKVASFILDFSEVLQSLCKVVKQGKLLVFTVGNRQVHKSEFPLHLVLKELAEAYGLTTLYDFRRNIVKNRNYVDTTKQGFKTINKETIMIFQKP